MALKTGIAWTDSTWNPWIGCTKIAPACDFCYAAEYDKRSQQTHWGAGIPRYRTAESTRNAPLVWNRNAAAFLAKHGHPQRVFTLSLGDWADNEIESSWRAEMWDTIDFTDGLRYQLCTKRVGNIERFLPANWDPTRYSHVGFLITCSHQEEADRDIPRLLDLKRRLGLRWVGISYEPALGRIVWRYPWMADAGGLDWIICGGESGKNARDDNPDWYRATYTDCKHTGTAFFMKQMAHLRPIPGDLMVREFPEALR